MLPNEVLVFTGCPLTMQREEKIIGLTVGPELQSNVYIKSLFASSSHA